MNLSTDGIDAGWKSVTDAFFATDNGRKLTEFLKKREDAGAVIYPPDPWRALRVVKPADVKVIILGQDPYHGPRQAVGMSFSVPPDLKPLPPSLRNIYKEIAREYDAKAPVSGDLTHWAEQGVLLLNAVLTVEEGSAGAHAKKGWEELTRLLIERVLQETRPKAFMLWGNWARSYAPMVREKAAGKVEILEANHPSPLSAMRPPVPFIGCGHFASANEFMVSLGENPVLWLPKEEASPVSGGQITLF